MDPRVQNERVSASRSREQPLQQAKPAEVRFQPQSAPRDYEQNTSKKKWVIAVVVLALLIAGGIAAWMKFAPSTAVNPEKYQAVFLINDQVYFGKIDSISSDTLVMKNIYYLQSSSTQQDVGQATSETKDQSNVSLVKLGDELHAPEDSMQINMDQVLFWENLRDEGKVSQAIKNYKK